VDRFQIRRRPPQNADDSGLSQSHHSLASTVAIVSGGESFLLCSKAPKRDQSLRLTISDHLQLEPGQPVSTGLQPI